MMDRRLSPHFRLSEFADHTGAAVPPGHLHGLRDLCQRYLEPLRRQFGPVTIISGYRTAAHNAAVGGAPLSRHVYGAHGSGVAADIRCERGTPRDWYRALDTLAPGGLGIYSTHVHVDNRPGRARW